MELPPRYAVQGECQEGKRLVCKLRKSLYGLKQCVSIVECEINLCIVGIWFYTIQIRLLFVYYGFRWCFSSCLGVCR